MWCLHDFSCSSVTYVKYFPGYIGDTCQTAPGPVRSVFRYSLSTPTVRQEETGGSISIPPSTLNPALPTNKGGQNCPPPLTPLRSQGSLCADAFERWVVFGSHYSSAFSFEQLETWREVFPATPPSPVSQEKEVHRFKCTSLKMRIRSRSCSIRTGSRSLWREGGSRK